MSCWLIRNVVFMGIICAGAVAHSAERNPHWAILIGVNDYVSLSDLKCCVADEQALYEVLLTCGFPEDQIVILHDDQQEKRYQPTRSNINKQINLLLRQLKRGDKLVFAFSGHGVLLDGHNYLCPTDADLETPSESMIDIDELYKRLETCGADFKLVMIDACRDDPRPPGKRTARSASDANESFVSKLSAPRGTILLTSCEPREQAQEDPKTSSNPNGLGHGVFMHFILKGLRGEAKNGDSPTVSVLDLYQYAERETAKYVARKFNDSQHPQMKGTVSGTFHFGISEPKWPHDGVRRRKLAREMLARIEADLPSIVAVRIRQQRESAPAGSPTPTEDDIAFNYRMMAAWDYARLGEAEKVRILLAVLLKNQKLTSSDGTFDILCSLARVIGMMQRQNPNVDLRSELAIVTSLAPKLNSFDLSSTIMDVPPATVAEWLLQQVADADDFSLRVTPATIINKLKKSPDLYFDHLIWAASNSSLITADDQRSLLTQVNSALRTVIQANQSSVSPTDNLLLAAIENRFLEVESLLKGGAASYSHSPYWVRPFALRKQIEEIERGLKSVNQQFLEITKIVAADSLMDVGDISNSRRLAVTLSGDNAILLVPGGDRDFPLPIVKTSGSSKRWISYAPRGWWLLGRLGDERLFREIIRKNRKVWAKPESPDETFRGYDADAELSFIDGLLAEAHD